MDLDLVASRNYGYIWHSNFCSLTISMSYKVGLCSYKSLFNKLVFHDPCLILESIIWSLIACIVGVRTKLNQNKSKLCLWLRHRMYCSFLTLNRKEWSKSDQSDSEKTNWVIGSTQYSSCSPLLTFLIHLPLKHLVQALK